MCRTWSPRGQTPQLEFHFNWKQLSAIAGITWWQFYFRLYPGAIRTPQVLNFLSHLKRQIRGRLLVIWDGLPIHRSRKVRAFLSKQRGHIILAALPAYAPELNPTEYIWGYWKNHCMANFCAKDFVHLSSFARRTLKRAQKRTPLVRAFWKQAELSL